MDSWVPTVGRHSIMCLSWLETTFGSLGHGTLLLLTLFPKTKPLLAVDVGSKVSHAIESATDSSSQLPCLTLEAKLGDKMVPLHEHILTTRLLRQLKKVHAPTVFICCLCTVRHVLIVCCWFGQIHIYDIVLSQSKIFSAFFFYIHKDPIVSW